MYKIFRNQNYSVERTFSNQMDHTSCVCILFILHFNLDVYRKFVDRMLIEQLREPCRL